MSAKCEAYSLSVIAHRLVHCARCVLLSLSSSVTERNRFSASLPEGPVSQSVLTCVDPDLVTINKRGALTVSLVNNMLCVAEDNSELTPRLHCRTAAGRRNMNTLFQFLPLIALCLYFSPSHCVRSFTG